MEGTTKVFPGVGRSPMFPVTSTVISKFILMSDLFSNLGYKEETDISFPSDLYLTRRGSTSIRLLQSKNFPDTDSAKKIRIPVIDPKRVTTEIQEFISDSPAPVLDIRIKVNILKENRLLTFSNMSTSILLIKAKPCYMCGGKGIFAGYICFWCNADGNRLMNS